MELKVTKEKVLEAAKVSKEEKEVLTKLFPKVFEEEKYFDFGIECLINDTFKPTSPLVIAYGMARNKGERSKVLLVNQDYLIEVIHNYNGGCVGIRFKKKI